jgi:hypothetical protein
VFVVAAGPCVRIAAAAFCAVMVSIIIIIIVKNHHERPRSQGPRPATEAGRHPAVRRRAIGGGGLLTVSKRATEKPFLYRPPLAVPGAASMKRLMDDSDADEKPPLLAACSRAGKNKGPGTSRPPSLTARRSTRRRARLASEQAIAHVKRGEGRHGLQGTAGASMNVVVNHHHPIPFCGGRGHDDGGNWRESGALHLQR